MLFMTLNLVGIGAARPITKAPSSEAAAVASSGGGLSKAELDGAFSSSDTVTSSKISSMSSF